MVEHVPQQTPTAPWRESPYLTFGAQALRIEGDPETPADFARALCYLETITTHWLECGPLAEKTAWDVAYELDYHNAWHYYEVEQERRSGEPQAEYHAINLNQLQAISKRRLLALETMSRAMTPAYQIVQYVDTLIEQAVFEQEQLEQLMAASAPAHPMLLPPSNHCTEDLSF